MPTREKNHPISVEWQPPQNRGRSDYQIKTWYVDSSFPSRLSELPYNLACIFADTSLRTWPLWPAEYGGGKVQPDLANCRGFYYMTTDPWDSRLYAGVYTRFVDAARQGSSEVGMNLVTYRQALKTFCQVSLTALTAVRGFVQAFRVALHLLRERRWNDWSEIKIRSRLSFLAKKRLKDQADKRRVSNEIWALQQVSGMFLAYRYGIAPLMDDLYNLANVLSGETKDVVSIRRSASTRVRSPYVDNLNGREDSYEWTETCTLRGTATVTNPNLYLANRLGVINPQVWVWDAIPFSFFVDWWLPIGSFLGNFTATAGLTLSGTSVTRSRRGTNVHRRWYSFTNTKSYSAYGTSRMIRKVRTTGSLPFPTSVPYGTGLGINRAQNALALIGQILSKKVR